MRGAGLLATKLFWVLAYDTEFAMVDRNDDRHLGIQTLALALGRFDATVVMGFYASTLQAGPGRACRSLPEWRWIWPCADGAVERRRSGEPLRGSGGASPSPRQPPRRKATAMPR